MQKDTQLHSGRSFEAGVQIGDFCIERRLGAGGMGIVYQAKQISLNRSVALKVLGPSLTQDSDVTRFQREAQAAARLRHPSIAQVYFIGQDRDLCFLAMELVEGISLRKALDRLCSATSCEIGIDSTVNDELLMQEPCAQQVRFDIPTQNIEITRSINAGSRPGALRHEDLNPYLTPKARELRINASHIRRCCEIARDASLALAHAQEQGVVHRDIKPDNLLLDRKGQVHLIDFGLARFFEDQAITYTGQLVGTPLYMSPEQVSGRGNIDARTDIYSLGLVLYELLTLRPAIEANSRENLLRSIITKPLVPVSWRNSAIPNDVERIVHRCTQKDPDDRYANAADLAADLDRYLDGKSVLAPLYRFRLDDREITAARPSGVVLAAFIIILIASILFLGLASVAVMTGTIGSNFQVLTMAWFQGIIGLFLLAAGIGVGRGLLVGRIWARWTGVGAAISICAVSLFLIISLGSMAMSISAKNNQSAVNPNAGTKLPAEEAQSVTDPAAPTIDNQRLIYGMLGMYMVPSVFGMVLGATALWSLLTRSTAAWFKTSRLIREEHRLLRRALA